MSTTQLTKGEKKVLAWLQGKELKRLKLWPRDGYTLIEAENNRLQIDCTNRARTFPGISEAFFDQLNERLKQ